MEREQQGQLVRAVALVLGLIALLAVLQLLTG